MRITGITAEMLKAGQDVVFFLTWMIIALFEKGIYPQDWATIFFKSLFIKR